MQRAAAGLGRTGRYRELAQAEAACAPPIRSTLATLQVLNPGGQLRVVVTKPLPGERWKQILAAAGCRVEVRPGGAARARALLPARRSAEFRN